MNSFVIGKLDYILPLYCQAPNKLFDKLYKVLMAAARSTVGNYCLKKSCTYIFNKCNWLAIKKIIKYAGISFAYKVLSKREPESIVNLYKSKIANRTVT